MAGAISSAGLGSGLDVASIVSQLVTIEKQPLKALQTKATSLQTQLSTYGQIQSQISALSDAATKLADSKAWNPLTLSSSNTAAVSGAATSAAGAGSYSIQVQQLAAAQSTVSPAVAAGANLGTGTLHIQLGDWAHGAAGFSGAAIDVSIGTGEDTLSGIAGKINAAAAGVTATIISDSSGQRLMLRSKDTGQAMGFRVQVTDGDGGNADAAGLSRLAYDPPGGTSATSLTQAAQNSALTLNGVALSTNSNTLADTLPGVTLKLTQVTSQPVDLSLSVDNAALKKNIQDFVDAYNTLNKTLTQATKYDAATKAAGALQGDRTTIGLQGSLRALLQSSTTGSSLERLVNAGVELQRDGSLSMNASKMDVAMADVSGLMNLFGASTGSEATNGIGLKIKNLTRSLLSVDGLVSSKNEAIQSAIKRNTDDQGKVSDRAARAEVRLRAQYTKLDATMSQMSALNTYVSQQITQWNKSTG